MITIKHMITGETIFSTEADTMKQALERAIQAEVDLTGADFWGQDLRGFKAFSGDISGAFFQNADLRDADFGVLRMKNATFTGAMMTNTPERFFEIRGAII